MKTLREGRQTHLYRGCTEDFFHCFCFWLAFGSDCRNNIWRPLIQGSPTILGRSPNAISRYFASSASQVRWVIIVGTWRQMISGCSWIFLTRFATNCLYCPPPRNHCNVTVLSSQPNVYSSLGHREEIYREETRGKLCHADIFSLLTI